MSSLSHILNTFSVENKRPTRVIDSAENLKSIMKSNPSLANSLMKIASDKSLSVSKYYNQSKECLKTLEIYETIITEARIDRNKKILSLKRMKAAGASIESLESVSRLYSLEGFGEFMKKMVAAILLAWGKIIEWIANIIQAIKNFFIKNKKAATPEQVKSLREIVQSEPERIIKAKRYKTSVKKLVETNISDVEASLKDLKDREVDIQKAKDALLNSIADAKSNNQLKAEAAEKVAQASSMRVSGNEKEYKAIAREEIYENGDSTMQEMKISEFFKSEDDYYPISPQFISDMGNLSKKMNEFKSLSTQIYNDFEKGIKETGSLGLDDRKNQKSLERLVNGYMQVCNAGRSQAQKTISIAGSVFQLLMNSNALCLNVMKQVNASS